MTDLSKLKELASKASTGNVFARCELADAMPSSVVLALIEVAEKARAVAFSNGFDAAFPDKMEALRCAVRAAADLAKGDGK